MMKMLLDLKTWRSRTLMGETPVFVASTSRDPELARIKLLQAGANPNAKAKDGWSALGR
jgi:hypothetical protein